ncbi:MAG: type 1 glutamine amidotransferase-like domain-containing protein [Sphaerospermopsis sp. SIO1G2]|nr:type 1 glutamine amidotransferase-like domain-containing protein [Sphaerospermopsis sp. SIO1G2]
MIDSWMNRGVAHFENLGAKATGVRVHDQQTAHDTALAAQIRQANFVYLSGGKPNYLYEVMHGSPVWEAIVSVHESGGIVAGCSAGAMIMGAQFVYSGATQAFGLVPNSVIIPHFDEFPGFLSRVMSLFKNSSLNMFGIDGYTALVVQDDQYTVEGLGGVTLIQQSGKTRYTHGEIITP